MRLGKEATDFFPAPSGIKIATAASKTPSLKHYVWSSLPGAEKSSGGKFTVPHCDSKAIIDEYIEEKLPELAQKTTFLWVGYYASNLVFFPMVKPEYTVRHLPGLLHFPFPRVRSRDWKNPAGHELTCTNQANSGKYTWSQPSSPDAIIPMAGDVSINIGLYVRAILRNPSASLPAKYAFVSTEDISHADTLKTWSEVTGKETEYVEVSVEKFNAQFGGAGGEFAAQLKWGETVPDWRGLKSGIVSARDLGVEEKELVGLKGYLEGVKGMLTA